MSMIHCRLGKDAKSYVYRMWSTIADGYLTEEMTREELMEYLLRAKIEDAMNLIFSTETRDRIERARKNGTSDRLGNSVSLTSEWEEERQ